LTSSNSTLVRSTGTIYRLSALVFSTIPITRIVKYRRAPECSAAVARPHARRVSRGRLQATAQPFTRYENRSAGQPDPGPSEDGVVTAKCGCSSPRTGRAADERNVLVKIEGRGV
jgi:hypothetical protein